MTTIHIEHQELDGEVDQDAEDFVAMLNWLNDEGLCEVEEGEDGEIRFYPES